MTLYALGGKQPAIGEGAWIAPSADVIGEVVLGARVTIWFGVVIRADNSAITIGDDSNVQDGSVLHSDADAPLAIGAGVTIGHKAILHGCTIGDGALVGMGATILNHAVIGAGSIVGANALVTEGKNFPPGSLIIGSPAKAVRSLTGEEQAMLRHGASSYVARGVAFAAELKRID
jgi:carbonic anhydrase/acetyltransferase-like protein (isoleucine patch superfamily)